MNFTLRCALVSVALTWLPSCSGHATLWLLDISTLETSTAEAGSTLELSGHGFPAGRTGELVLRGELRTAGESPRQVSLTLRAQSVSSTRVSAFVDEASAQTVGGHATFEGRAQLRFAQENGPWIAGEARNIVLEWAGNEDANDARLRRDGQRVMESLGLDVNEPAAETGSVRVSGVHAGGIAAGTRIVIGDRIVSANGLHVRSLADLAQPSAATSIRLLVRDAVDAQRTLELELPRPAGAMLDGYRYLLWVCPVLVALLLLGPWPAPIEFLRAGMSRLRRARFALFRPFERSTARTREAVIAWTALCAAASSLAAWAGSGLTLSAALAGYLVLLVLRAWRLPLDAGAPSLSDPIERRAQALSFKLKFLGRGAVVCLVVAGSGVLGGSSSLAMLASEQGAVPWGWSVFARPTTWLAGWILLSCTGRLHATVSGAATDVVLDNLGRIVLTTSIAAVWLGGGSTGALGIWPALDLGLGSALFAVKLFAALCVLSFVQPMATATLRQVARGSFALIALSIAYGWVAPERALEMRVGCAVLVSLLLASSLAMLEYLSQRRVPNPAL